MVLTLNAPFETSGIQLNWDAISTVLLDMDGTLLDLHFDNYFWLQHLPLRYAQKNNLTTEEAFQHLEPRMRKHQGQLNWYCVDFWSAELDLDVAALKREVDHKIAFRPNVIPFLREVRNQQKRCVIVTNAHQASIAIKIEKTALHEHVDRIISAHDIRAPKEDQQFWVQLQQQEPFNEASTLLIDDSLPVLRSAQRYGIAHLLTIRQPDSQQPGYEQQEFPALGCFAEITPA